MALGLAAVLAPSAGAASAQAKDLSGSRIGQLASVSCSSTRACTAVGEYTPGYDHPGASVPLAYRWNGKRWSRQNLPSLSEAVQQAGGAVLNGVSCPSAKSCIAVGQAGGSGLAERWNGSTWKVQSLPDAASATLSGVSCSSARACTAIGESGGSTEAWRWNGPSWSSEPISSPAQSSLSAIACPSAKVCIAVGSKPNGSNDAVLVERWNGSGWTEQSAPSPRPVSGGPHLISISCSSVRSCTAVGGRGWGVLVEHWNGSKWAQQTAPRGDTNALFYGVSCPTAKRCVAVGEYNERGGNLAESWNGKKWTLMKIPTPAPHSVYASGVDLFGVSCRSARACEAVGAGGDFSDNVERPVAEGWNGRRWRIQ